MPRERSPNRNKAFEIFKEYDGNIENRAIAEMLGEKEKTISNWKCRDKWNVVLQKNECSTTKEKGGQPGNKNAAGNKGGAAPKLNKNAVKTGEFETFFFDTLDSDEQQFIALIKSDKEQLLLKEIQLLTIRERRMLKRIDNLRKLEDMEGEETKEVPAGMSVVKYTSGLEKGKLTELKEYEGILGQIQAIEDALTRVQTRQQKAIETLHKFEYDDAHLELETMKFELEILKQGGQDKESGDDGFLDAMNIAASDVWGDADE